MKDSQNGIDDITSTLRYEMCRNSAMMNAAAPSVGGLMMAPMPAAEGQAPAVSASYPERLRSGHPTDPSVTVVATPLPDTVPSRPPAIVIARPGPAPPPERPTAASDHSRKNLPAPDASSTAP